LGERLHRVTAKSPQASPFGAGHAEVRAASRTVVAGDRYRATELCEDGGDCRTGIPFASRIEWSVSVAPG